MVHFQQWKIIRNLKNARTSRPQFSWPWAKLLEAAHHKFGQMKRQVIVSGVLQITVQTALYLTILNNIIFWPSEARWLFCRQREEDRTEFCSDTRLAHYPQVYCCPKGHPQSDFCPKGNPYGSVHPKSNFKVTFHPKCNPQGVFKPKDNPSKIWPIRIIQYFNQSEWS